MSSIEKMTIQGIRSFGPDEEHRQIIEFFSPLTLILGPNGTGKTTIIECLKYMTTGDLPPGGKQNAAFIHDPKVAGETEVKAQVRLRFRDVQSQRCDVARSLLATQKAKKIELKTLDCTITRKDKAGNLHSISSKCAEMDREMVTLLGVSKPVLDSVIFCHQEEANWPLSEGKALKTRFDDIFASTRYVKALEVIRKFRTDQVNEVKLYSKDICYLKQNKDKAMELKSELVEKETKYQASRDSVRQIKDKMEPIQAKLEQLRAKSQDIFKLSTKIEKMQTERTQIERTQRELRQNIKNDFDGSTNELKTVLKDFAGNLEQKEVEVRGLETSEDKIKHKILQISDDKSELLMTQGKLEEEAERQRKNIKTRDKMIEKLADEYNVTGYVAPLSDKKISQFLKVLEEKEQDMEEDLRKKRATREEEEDKVQEDIDELRETKTKLETELQMKLETLNKNRKEIRTIKDQLSRVDASAGKLEDIQRDLKKTEREQEEAQKGVDLDSLKSDVQQLQKTKARLDADNKTLDAELTRLTRESTARTQLDMYKKERTSKVDNVRKLKAKIEDSMKHLVGHMPTENLRRELYKVTSKNDESKRTTSDKLNKLRNEKTQKDTTTSMLREQLTKREAELRDKEEKLNRVSGSQSFDEGLEILQASLKSSQNELGTLTGVEFMYDRYKQKLGAEDPPCPLCNRRFDNTAEVEELVTDIESRLTMMPTRTVRVQKKIDVTSKKVEDMLQLKPVKAAMTELTEEAIPNLKQKIRSITDQMERLSTDIEDKSKELNTLSDDEEAAKIIQTDVALIDKLNAELKELDRKVAQQSANLSGGDSERSLHDVNSERENLQMELETCNRTLDRKRQQISDQRDQLQSLSDALNELRTEKLQIESDLQQRVALENKRTELESSNDTLDREVKDSREEIKPLQSSIGKKDRQKQELQRDKEDEYAHGQGKVSEVKEEHRKVRSHNTDITNYISRGRDQELQKNSDAMDALEARAARLADDQRAVSDQIQQMKDELTTQKVRERELSDIMAVRRKQQEVDELGERIGELEEKMGGLDTSNLNHDIGDLEDRRSNLDTQKQQAVSRQTIIETEIINLKKQLRDDIFKDAEAQYSEKMIALRTTELANQDLDKYYRALDRTIMSYHSQKMAEINKIIRELWRNTYKGVDIETIEIRSDEEDADASAKTRRTYNYRVVMVKGDTVMDMRNRCSAGQKVLASLIIRLALAETFCLNCGILALDEPTTNLDRENIESLAFALVEIIKSRSRQRNFQLAIITHDEDFVELLGRSEYVDEFFKVRKSAEGHSQLVRAKVQDLHTR